MLAAKAQEQMADQFGAICVENVVSLVNMDSYLRILDSELSPRSRLPVVLVHGDVHNMNMIFEKRASDGRAGDKLLALFDYQLSHKGYGTEDMARLLVMGTSSVIRRQHGDAILMRYVEVFNSKVHPRQQVSYEDVKEAFDDMFGLIAIWISMSAAMAEDFLKKSLDKIDDEYRRKEIVDEYILNNAYLYQDAAKILGW